MADLLVGMNKTGPAVLVRLAETVGASLPGAPVAAGVPRGMIEGEWR
jgi:hypothetical protein